MTRLQTIFDSIDTFNQRDPKQTEVSGHLHPYEVVFSCWLTSWVEKLNPNAAEPLRIAARGQHIGRWTIPRESYPMDRGGYLRWREELKKFHAKTVGELMDKAGYGIEDIAHTQAIILKKNFKNDPDAQTMEDALCLTFLEHQFPEFRKQTPDDKMVEILRKSWGKMSAQGREAALAIALGPEEKALIQKALAA